MRIIVKFRWVLFTILFLVITWGAASATLSSSADFATIQNDNFTSHFTVNHCPTDSKLFSGYVTDNKDNSVVFSMCYEMFPEIDMIHMMSMDMNIDVTFPMSKMEINVSKMFVGVTNSIKH